MKKILALILAAMMIFAVVSCGAGDAADTGAETGADTGVDTGADTGADTEESTGASYGSALELLETVWNTYGDDEKFFIGGGNTYNPDSMTMDAPGKFVALEDTDYDANIGYPAADAAKLDDAAAMFHGMNVNNFTCSALHFADSADASAMVEAIKSNIMARQWICGFPEKLVIMSVPGDYLIVMWGLGADCVDIFANKTIAAIEGAEILVDEAIVG